MEGHPLLHRVFKQFAPSFPKSSLCMSWVRLDSAGTFTWTLSGDLGTGGRELSWVFKKLKQQQNKTLLSYSPQTAATECHRLGALTQQIYFRGPEASKCKVKAPARSVSEGGRVLGHRWLSSRYPHTWGLLYKGTETIHEGSIPVS